MGTETHRPMTVQIQFHHINVKLNNPLMGTETSSLRFRYSFDNFLELN